MRVIEKIKDAIDGILANVNTKSREHVVLALNAAAANNPEALEWPTSVTDLLKLCNLPSDIATRKSVAEDFGIKDYTGTAEQNVRLHAIIFDDLRRGGIDLPQPSTGC